VGLGWEVNLEDGGGVQTQFVLRNSGRVVVTRTSFSTATLRLLVVAGLSSVFDAMRLIGRKFSDAEVQPDIKCFPFNVIYKAGKALRSRAVPWRE